MPGKEKRGHSIGKTEKELDIVASSIESTACDFAFARVLTLATHLWGHSDHWEWIYTSPPSTS